MLSHSSPFQDLSHHIRFAVVISSNIMGGSTERRSLRSRANWTESWSFGPSVNTKSWTRTARGFRKHPDVQRLSATGRRMPPLVEVY
jgi:hypothetical protein